MVVLHGPLVALYQRLPLTVAHLIREQVALIDELHILVDGAGLQHLIEGIDVVAHGGEDLTAHAGEKFPDGDVLRQVAIDRYALDERAHRVRELRVRSAIVDGGEGHMLCVEIFSQHQGHRAHEEAALGDAQLVAEGPDPLHRERARLVAHILADARREGPFNVAAERGDVVHSPEQVGVILFRGLVGPVQHALLFMHRRLLDGTFLCMERSPGQRAVELADDQADGGAVHENEMALQDQVAALHSPIDGEMKQQLPDHGHDRHIALHEFEAILPFAVKHGDIHLSLGRHEHMRHTVRIGSDDILHGGMRGDHSPDRVDEFLRREGRVGLHQVRQRVRRGVSTGRGFKVYAHLRLRERVEFTVHRQDVPLRRRRVDAGGEPAGRRILHDILKGEPRPQVSQLRHEDGRADGGSAQLKEIRCHADLLQPQGGGERPADLLFCFGLRRDVFAFFYRGLHGVQRDIVNLVAVIARQRLKANEVVRHHILRQVVGSVGRQP